LIEGRIYSFERRPVAFSLCSSIFMGARCFFEERNSIVAFPINFSKTSVLARSLDVGGIELLLSSREVVDFNFHWSQSAII
jgi:hypothetical protein